MKEFIVDSRFFKKNPIKFTECNAPNWLTGVSTQKGSSMDTRWFWEEHVLKLEVGASIETDFNIVTRVT